VSGDAAQALARADAALALDATLAAAHFVAARAALASEDPARALREVEALLAAHHDGYDVRLMAARAALAQSKPDVARSHLEAATRIDADRPEAWMGRLELARQAHDDDARREVLIHIAGLDEHSREISAELLDNLSQLDDWLLTGQTDLQWHINTHWYTDTGFGLQYDNVPAEGSKSLDTTYTVGFGYKF